MRLIRQSSIARGALLSSALLLASSPSALAQNKHTLPLFLSASNHFVQGFVRIINHSDRDGTVRIFAIDDSGKRFGPVALSLNASGARQFNSRDLEEGNPVAGLARGLGSGEGDWRLELDTALDIEPLAYVRTPDGFLTSMHDVVASESMTWRVPILNPATNTRLRSLLRVVNTSGTDTEVRITGVDARGDPSPEGEVSFSLPGNEARTLSARDLEAGYERDESEFSFDGRLGDGWGKWQLFVSADQPIQVMSLLLSASGHLTNLSTGGPRPTDEALQADPSIARILTDPIEQGESTGLFGAIVDKDGVQAIAVAGVRKEGSPQELTVHDPIVINSNTKAMTSTMLATLVADGTFARGWQTTIAEVFPELVGQIHHSYHSVNLRQLVNMTAGIRRDPQRWWDYWGRDIVETRYRILADNLTDPPAGRVGQFLYSNLGYMIAGAMAERLTRKSWETLMEERLFAPLGMSDAAFLPIGPFYGVDRPWGHERNEGGSWAPRRYSHSPGLGPAGTVTASVEDWAKFIGLWFPDREPAILDRSALDELISRDFGTPTSHSEFYAAGWAVTSRSWAGGVAMVHTGASCCWRTVLWVAPERGVAYVAASNASDIFEDDHIHDVLESVIGNLINHNPSREIRLVPVTKKDVLTPNLEGMPQHVPSERKNRLHREP